ncbi:DUF3108 domain-containing protein [Rhodovibrionaceae bacterium A322]
MSSLSMNWGISRVSAALLASGVVFAMASASAQTASSNPPTANSQPVTSQLASSQGSEAAAKSAASNLVSDLQRKAGTELTDGSGADFAEYHYRVDWGPVTLAALRVYFSKGEKTRALAAEGETLGVLSVFNDWTFSQAMVTEEDKMTVFSSQSFKDGDPQADFEVVWAPSDPEVSGKLGKQAEKELTPIPMGELNDTISPYQPIFHLAEKLADGQSCDLEERIFDGVRRYNVKVVEVAREELEADRDWTYGGPTVKCQLIFQKIGGFSTEASSWTVKKESDVERILWLARLREDLWIPVRLKVSSPLGYATGRLVTDPAALAAQEKAGDDDSWFSFGNEDK